MNMNVNPVLAIGLVAAALAVASASAAADSGALAKPVTSDAMGQGHMASGDHMMAGDAMAKPMAKTHKPKAKAAKHAMAGGAMAPDKMMPADSMAKH